MWICKMGFIYVFNNITKDGINISIWKEHQSFYTENMSYDGRPTLTRLPLLGRGGSNTTPCQQNKSVIADTAFNLDN